MKFAPLVYIDLASNVLPIGAGFFKRSLLIREKLIFFLFVVASVVIEIIGMYLASHHTNNLWLIHIYNLIEFTLLMMIYARWQENGLWQRLLYFSIILFAIFWIVSKWTIEGFFEPSQYTRTVSSVIFIPVASIMLINLMREEGMVIHRDYRFWISAGVLLNFAGNIMLFLYNGPISNLRIEEWVPIWTIHWIISIAVNLFYMGGFLCMKK